MFATTYKCSKCGNTSRFSIEIQPWPGNLAFIIEESSIKRSSDGVLEYDIIKLTCLECGSDQILDIPDINQEPVNVNKGINVIVTANSKLRSRMVQYNEEN